MKLYEQGLEAIEVSDDGSGVPPSSRPLMATKHATSKLRRFDDLYATHDGVGDGVACAPTLGFRGEALFCLANLSRSLEVSTRSSDDDANDANDENNKRRSSSLGEQFAFDAQGRLIPSSVRPVPRPVGTTVTVRGLFESLPVRRADLRKRVKGQRLKLIKMLQGCECFADCLCMPTRRPEAARSLTPFRREILRRSRNDATNGADAILCLGAQFSLVDVGTSKRKSRSSLTTSASSDSLEARTASVLGTKFLAGLTRIEIDLSDAASSSAKAAPATDAGEDAGEEDARRGGAEGGGRSAWTVRGLVSHAPASARPASARDLQFFSVNGRPVDLPSVSRALTDAWRHFDPATEGRRRPACVLAFALPNDAFDVNLSPDKREVMFSQGARVDGLVREGAMKVWAGQSGGEFRRDEAGGAASRKGGRVEEADLNVDSSEGKRASEGGEKGETSADRNDNVTPRVGEKTKSFIPGADSGAVVTPLDSPEGPTDRNASGPFRGEGSNAVNGENEGGIDASTALGANAPQSIEATDVAGGTNGGGNGVSSAVENGPLLSKEAAPASGGNDAVPCREEAAATVPCREEAAAPPQRGGEKQQALRSWDRPQLPQRAARQRDRRGWEQMQLKFQRVEKRETQQMLSAAVDGADRRRSDAGCEEAANHTSSANPSNATGRAAVSRRPSQQSAAGASARRAARNEGTTSRRESKRRNPRKRDVTAFLDTFSYGATKPAVASKETESESEDAYDSDDEGFKTSLEDSEVQEVADAPRRPSMKENYNPARNERDAKMVVGRIASQKKRPRTSASEPTRDEETDPLASYPSSEENGHHEIGHRTDEEPETSDNGAEPGTSDNDAASPPIETVWDSFAGTKHVIEQSQKARLMMYKGRKRLQSSVKKIEKSGDDDTIRLSPEEFLHMSIIGQFNLGFILVRCRDNQIWILDQHACDEKYNFERLCRETVIHEQKLIAPLPLELSPSEEHCVLEHMDVFERNGFRFSYDPDGEPRRRLSLTALPHSGSGGDGRKAVQFGREDVGALCAMLGADGGSSAEAYADGFGASTEGGRIAGVNAVRRYAGLVGGLSRGGAVSDGIVGSSIVRLPKAIEMLANRACRVSYRCSSKRKVKFRCSLVLIVKQ